ncbi:MAG: YicC family protein [Candidatus Eisenbacteria bacterium]|nr:YicC family protein [Candidatus Eisenbacteria bacterium]
MIRSMTGFGRSEIQRQGVLLVTEIRSVNNKFCDVSLRLPKWLAHFEPKVRALVQQRILRGKLAVFVTWNGDDGDLTLGLDANAADRYFGLLKALKERYNLSGEITLQMLMSFPDLLSPEKGPAADEMGWKLVEEGVTKAIDDVVSMKEAEGKSLSEDLRARVNVLLEYVARVEKRAPVRVGEAKEKLRTRLSELLGRGEIPEDRLALEVVIFTDKLDCTEECVRLRAHAKQFVALIDGPEFAGRKLHFLLQEMNREANTIGAKAADVEIVNEIVSIKDEIEKLREQVQNVE